MARAKKTAIAETLEPAPAEVLVTYKGFDKNLSCRGFGFEVGKTYTVSGTVRACSNGFHGCINPWDILGYYPLLDGNAEFNRFGKAEQTGAIDRHHQDSKIASASITVKAEFTIPQFIGKLVEWIVDATAPGKIEKPKVVDGSGTLNDKGDDNARIGSSGYSARIGSSGNDARIGSSGYDARIGSSGYSARIGSSGNDARIGSSGYDAQIGSSGYSARIGSSGNSARIGSSGNDAQIGSSGYSARIGSSGNDARIGSSGNDAQIGSSGYSAQIGSSGYSARIKAEGENSVIATAGYYTRVRGVVGTWISLAEFNSDGKCVGFATGCIGTDGIPADTWLIAKDGKLVAEVA